MASREQLAALLGAAADKLNMLAGSIAMEDYPEGFDLPLANALGEVAVVVNDMVGPGVAAGLLSVVGMLQADALMRGQMVRLVCVDGKGS